MDQDTVSQTTGLSTDYSKIADTLRVLFAEQTGSETPMVRVGSSNFFILNLSTVGSNADRLALANSKEQLIAKLSRVHPCRFFLINLGAELTEIDVSVAARCHRGPNGQSLCSEVVTLEVPFKRLAALPSILLANLLTGMQTELFITSSVFTADEEMAGSVLDHLLPIVDLAIYDSAEGCLSSNVFKQLINSKGVLVDLNWLRTSVWREQLREICNKPAVLSKLADLNEIEVVLPEKDQQRPENDFINSGPYFIAAWMVRKLGLTPVARTESGVFKLVDLHRHPDLNSLAASFGRSFGHQTELKVPTVELSFPSAQSKMRSEDGINSVRVCFSSQSDAPQQNDNNINTIDVHAGLPQLVLARAEETPNTLLGTVNLNQCLKISAQARVQDTGDLLIRWYSGAVTGLEYAECYQLAVALSGS